MKTFKDFDKEDAISQVDTAMLEQDEYTNIPAEKIALLIQEYHSEKPTNTLIESYIQLASSKIFYPDPVVIEIRKLNQFSTIVPGKIDFKLSDGSLVTVSEATLDKLYEIGDSLREKTFSYMRENINNFLEVIKTLEG